MKCFIVSDPFLFSEEEPDAEPARSYRPADPSVREVPDAGPPLEPVAEAPTTSSAAATRPCRAAPVPDAAVRTTSSAAARRVLWRRASARRLLEPGAELVRSHEERVRAEQSLARARPAVEMRERRQAPAEPSHGRVRLAV